MSDDARPRSHWWPRTAAGRRVLVVFLVGLAAAQPPLVYLLANRVEPRLLGFPWLYVWLLGAYVVMIGALVAAWRRGL